MQELTGGRTTMQELTGGRTTMQELTGGFRDYANAPKCLRTAA